MRLECVSVCLGYSDFLTHTVRNRPLFDRWVIVTSASDEPTRELCRKHNLETVLTEDMRADGEFSKGRAVNRGLEMLSCGSWWLRLDADIILPPTFGQLLEAAQLREECLYGWDRVMCRSWDEYQRT